MLLLDMMIQLQALLAHASSQLIPLVFIHNHKHEKEIQ
jgi:hypothetical protein